MAKESERIFPYKTKFYARKTFMNMRKRIAHKGGNLRILHILHIHFHTFRHGKATMENRETTAYYYTSCGCWEMRRTYPPS